MLRPPTKTQNTAAAQSTGPPEDTINPLLIRSDVTGELLNSMVLTLLGAIDEICPYNAKHTKNMAAFAENFFLWQDRNGIEGPLLQKDRDSFLLCIRVHDIGKVAVPGEIIGKSNRLGSKISDIEHRFREIELIEQLRLARGDIDRNHLRAEQVSLMKIREQISFYDRKPRISDEDAERIHALGGVTYVDEFGQEQPLLKREELSALMIPRGTLSPSERKAVEYHVVETGVILSKVEFPEAYRNVPTWAKMHHELLDGSGYPNHLKGDSIPPPVRFLTILDIFEALTASDRPYKQGMSPEKALGILRKMADSGKIDADILSLFERSCAWEYPLAKSG